MNLFFLLFNFHLPPSSRFQAEFDFPGSVLLCTLDQPLRRAALRSGARRRRLPLPHTVHLRTTSLSPPPQNLHAGGHPGLESLPSDRQDLWSLPTRLLVSSEGCSVADGSGQADGDVCGYRKPDYQRRDFFFNKSELLCYQ